MQICNYVTKKNEKYVMITYLLSQNEIQKENSSPA